LKEKHESDGWLLRREGKKTRSQRGYHGKAYAVKAMRLEERATSWVHEEKHLRHEAEAHAQLPIDV
jgi:hypothetical protein